MHALILIASVEIFIRPLGISFRSQIDDPSKTVHTNPRPFTLQSKQFSSSLLLTQPSMNFKILPNPTASYPCTSVCLLTLSTPVLHFDQPRFVTAPLGRHIYSLFGPFLELLFSKTPSPFKFSLSLLFQINPGV